MTSLLHQDYRREDVLPAAPLHFAVHGEGTQDLAELGIAAPPNIQIAGPSDETGAVAVFAGTNISGQEFQSRLAQHPRAMLAIVDVPRWAPGSGAFARHCSELITAAARHGFALLDLCSQAPADIGGECRARLFFERDCHFDGSHPDPLLNYALVLDACGLQSRARAVLADLAASEERCSGLANAAYLRAARIEGFGPLSPAADFARRICARPSEPGWDRAAFPILVSIHIQSNNPENLTRFCDRIANSCDDPSRVEVIVKIDDDHAALNELLPKEVIRQPFQLKFISTPLVGGFFALWKSMNDMLAITDPGAYFLLNLNDEMYFAERGWDTRLARYVGLFPDHLYRLRTSIYRNRNYHDHWECGFAPETSAITTKRWIETGGNWNPCLGPDTFQQCVAYYFNLINRRLPHPRYREIPIDDIGFGGEGAYAGLTGNALRRRVRGATKAWYRLMSPEIQQEAARRAAKIQATITAEETGLGDLALVVNDRRRCVAVVEPGGRRIIAEYSFAVPWAWYRTLNARRAVQFYAFGGGGSESRHKWLASFLSFLALRYDWADKLRSVVREQPEMLTGTLGRVHRGRVLARRLWHGLARFVWRYVVHAPDYLRLFYHRKVKHLLRLMELIARRAAGYAKVALRWFLIGWPRRLNGHLGLFYRRNVLHWLGLGELAARRARGYGKVALWWFLIGWPRRLRGHLALFYRREVLHWCGLMELAVRLGLGYAKVALWRLLVGWPRRLRGHMDLAVRRGLGYSKVALWRLLVGWPRRLRGQASPAPPSSLSID
jgi:hypothetical protein